MKRTKNPERPSTQVTVQLTPELFQQFKEHMRAEQERTGYQISQADILRAMIVNTVKGAK